MSDHRYELRMRLKFNLYACRTAKDRLEKAIENNDNHEIYTAIGELLLWIMTTNEWFIKHGLKDYKRRANRDPKGTLILGLAHAYNSMKHNMDFFTIHYKNAGFSFNNIDFANLDFRPSAVRWIYAGELLKGVFESQRINYIKYIEGKEVLDTFNDALLFLNNEAQKYLFKNE